MYKKTSKIDRAITIVAPTLLIVIVATAPVLSYARIALAQQPTATLTVSNIIRANCTYSPNGHSCPQDTNMYTTIFNSKPFQRFTFSPGRCCGEQYATTQSYSIPIGNAYQISTRAAADCCPSGKTPVFKFELANIQGSPPFGTGGCTGTNECIGHMGPSGAKVLVNYHWKCTADTFSSVC